MHVPVAGGRLDRCGRVVRGEVILALKAAHVADVSQHGRRDDRPDTVDVGDRRLRRGNKLCESLLHLAAVLIDTANTGKKITSELQPRGAGSTVRFNLVHDDGRLSGGDFLGEATRDQIAETACSWQTSRLR